jgi:hypothetical protein
MTETRRKKISYKDYDIYEGLVCIRCSCGNDVWLDYDEPNECEICGKKYDLVMYVVNYEEVEVDEEIEPF